MSEFLGKALKYTYYLLVVAVIGYGLYLPFKSPSPTPPSDISDGIKASRMIRMSCEELVTEKAVSIGQSVDEKAAGEIRSACLCVSITLSGTGSEAERLEWANSITSEEHAQMFDGFVGMALEECTAP